MELITPRSAVRARVGPSLIDSSIAQFGLERSAVNRKVGGSSPPGRDGVRMPEWSKGSRLGRDTKVRGFKPHSAQVGSSVV